MSIFGYTVKIIIFGVIEDITELPQFPITVTSSCPLKNCYAPSRRRVERVEDVFDTARLVLRVFEAVAATNHWAALNTLKMVCPSVGNVSPSLELAKQSDHSLNPNALLLSVSLF